MSPSTVHSLADNPATLDNLNYVEGDVESVAMRITYFLGSGRRPSRVAYEVISSISWRFYRPENLVNADLALLSRAMIVADFFQ